MTKTELQSALAEATQTDKRTAGVFLDTLGALAYKEIKKTVVKFRVAKAAKDGVWE
jgi:nucleoid DNA-binding protein